MDDRIGQQLGNYRLISLLGMGALTKVYLGEHIYLNTLAAIKVSDALLDIRSIFAFKREAGVLAQLVHPNIVRVLEFGVEQDSVAYLVVTYVPRGTFPRNYSNRSPLSPVVILPYVKQLCSALQYAHDKGVVHRDIRPEHILLGDDNEALLDHFGSNWINLLSEKGSMADILKEPSAANLFDYQAPEQLRGISSKASDQYALGVVIYEWLSGERPFKGTGPEIAMQQLNTPPPALHEKLPAIAPQLEQVVLKALAKDPQQRFPSIQDFANAFERACFSEQASLTASAKFPSISPSHALLNVSTPKNSIKLFFSYSHKDEKLRNELAKQLTLLKRNGLISDWYDRDIDAGTEWAHEIDTHLNDADIILLLISPDFIASDYCYNLEMMRALERHENGEASVIPIILRPVTWKETPFGKLQVLPQGGKAVTTWSNRDEAFLHIAEGIRKVVEKSNEKKPG